MPCGCGRLACATCNVHSEFHALLEAWDRLIVRLVVRRFRLAFEVSRG
jgi:hypothetical protein